MDKPLYPLGRTGIELTPIGLGCWQFSGGKGLVGRYWKAIDQSTINEIVAAAATGGVNWFDTAEAYGLGRSEEALSTALQTLPGDRQPIVATKWIPFFRFARSIRKTFDARSRHLAPFPVTLHQVHAPVSFSSIDRQMDEMAALARSGAIRTVGVSNFSAEQMRTAHKALQRHGLVLASNQVRYNLLDRRIEANGTMAAAKELGVSIIAYSPLEQGVLTGRFHRDADALRNLSGPRRLQRSFRSGRLEETKPLIEALERVATAHSASAAQIALAWTVQRHAMSVFAIPGASSVRQAEGNAAAMSVRLTSDELQELDEISRRVS